MSVLLWLRKKNISFINDPFGGWIPQRWECVWVILRSFNRAPEASFAHRTILTSDRTVKDGLYQTVCQTHSFLPENDSLSHPVFHDI